MSSDVQAALALLQAELTRIREAALEAWRNYLSWFTWFFSTQTLMLGWLMTMKEETPVQKNIAVLGAALILFNILGVTEGMRQRTFCRLQGERADRICRSIAEHAERIGLTVEITPGFATHMIRAALTVFVFALSSTSALWLFLILKSRQSAS